MAFRRMYAKRAMYRVVIVSELYFKPDVDLVLANMVKALVQNGKVLSRNGEVNTIHHGRELDSLNKQGTSGNGKVCPILLSRAESSCQ
jgi:hypothetical protein